MSRWTADTRSGLSSVVSATSYPEIPPSPCSAPNTVSRDLGPGERKSDSNGFEALHTYFLDRLAPVCARLPDAAVDAGEVRHGTHAYELTRGIGNLCVGRDDDPRYGPRRLVEPLLGGLRRPQPS